MNSGDASGDSDAAAGRREAAANECAPSKEDRIDFLKQAIAFSEWSIRSFDTKAQISIAAFVLSMNPLWSILTSAHPRVGSSLAVVVLLVMFVMTVVLFGFVIWPASPPPGQLSGGWQTKGLFYVGDPNLLTASLYAYRLKALAIETELAAETLKLASIRNIKSQRFKHALVSTAVFYAAVVVSFLILRSCGSTDKSWLCGY
jgi:hypothetical protein